MNEYADWFANIRVQAMWDFYTARDALALTAFNTLRESNQNLVRLQALLRAAFFVAQANELEDCDFLALA